MADFPSPRSDDQGRNLAMISYGLLFAAVFFAGIPALIAVIIAYTQRDEATPAVRTHYNFQIRIFCVAFALSMTAAACLLAALVFGLADLFAYARIDSFMGGQETHIDFSRMWIDARVIGLVAGGVILSFLTAIWLVAAPAFGFIRLASAQRIGQSPAT